MIKKGISYGVDSHGNFPGGTNMFPDRSILKVLIVIILLFSCGGSPDKRDWQRAHQEDTILAFEFISVITKSVVE